MSEPPQQPAPPGRPRHRRLWLLGLGLGAVAVVGGIVYWSGRSAAERADALQVARDGDFSRAEPLLVKALDRDPHDAEVAEVLARGHLKSDDEQAEAFLSRWVAAAPNQPEPLRARMEFYRKHKHPDEAYADGRRLLALAPDDPELERTVVSLGFSAGRFEETEALCEKYLRDRPDDLGLRVTLSRVLHARGNLTGAAAILDEILKAKPNNPIVMFDRAILYNDAGNPEAAIPLLREILRIDRTRQRTAGYQLALALEKVGRPDEARQVMVEVRRRQDVEVFRDTIQNQPDNLDLHVRLAKSLLDDGHTEDGTALLQTVLGRDPGFRPAHRILADYYQRVGDKTRAEYHRRLAGP